MYAAGTEQHFFTVRGRGFDHKQWKAVTELSQGIVARAKETGISAECDVDARRIVITSSEEGVSPLVIWRKGEPGIPKEVLTRGRYDDLVQSILTATKKVAPDIFEMTSPDGRNYRRILARESLPEIKKIIKNLREKKEEAFQQAVDHQRWPHPETKNRVKFISLPKKEQTRLRHKWEAEYGHLLDQDAQVAMQKVREAEKAKADALHKKDKAEAATTTFRTQKEKAQQGKKIQPKKTPAKKTPAKKAMTMTEDSIRKAAIRVASSTEDKLLKQALLEILRETVGPTAKSAKSESEEAPQGKEDSVDVGEFLKSKGHEDDAAQWNKHKCDMGKKSSAALVFPEIHDLAWHHVLAVARAQKTSKTASGSTAQRVILADRLAKKWIQDAIKRPGRVHEYLGIPEGETIPAGKLNDAIAKVKEKGDDKSLLSALLLAKRFKKGIE